MDISSMRCFAACNQFVWLGKFVNYSGCVVPEELFLVKFRLRLMVLHETVNQI